jgi:phosphate transporter
LIDSRAANVGGMASPIASPQNVIAIGNMHPSVSWFEWFLISLPVCLLIDLIIWILLLFVYKPTDQNTSPPELFSLQKNKPLTGSQIFVLVGCAVTVVLWCVQGSLESVVGDMGVIAILPMVLFFGAGILTKDDFNNFLWTLILLAMGGHSLFYPL